MPHDYTYSATRTHSLVVFVTVNECILLLFSFLFFFFLDVCLNRRKTCESEFYAEAAVDGM